MDDVMKIHLLIDNERYPLTIRREDELLYRNAAKQIDNKLNKYRSRFPDFSPTRHWAMAALELAFENISMKDKNNTEPYQEKLKELTKEIEQYLSIHAQLNCQEKSSWQNGCAFFIYIN